MHGEGVGASATVEGLGRERCGAMERVLIHVLYIQTEDCTLA